MQKVIIQKQKILKLSISLLLSFFMVLLFSQETTSSAGMKVYEDRIRTGNEGFASDAFRLGVQSYYRGAFNEAVLQFETALSYLPNDNLILEWLGKSYYKTGLEGSALGYWQSAVNNGYGGLLLQNKIEIVRERRVTGDSQDKFQRLSEAGSFPGFFNGNMIFSGPVSLQSNYDGTLWVSAYNSNEIVLINQNGKVIDRVEGPVNGFDRPSDILRLHSGKLLVSEFAGDRLALLSSSGRFEKYIGKKGRALGELAGPLYLAQDYLERIYVTDYGNRRVDVFDKDGEAIFNFGGSQSNFSGLKGPTGIAVIDDYVFVADDYTGTVYQFDRSGNYIRDLVEEKTFSHPESLKVWNNQLVICDSSKVLSIDCDTGSLFEFVRTGNAPSRVTTASPDVNGNLLVSDFTANEVYVMSQTQELVGGLFVQIEQIDSSKFPNVTVELRVENRHRQPLVGLLEENFYLSENKQPVTNLRMLGAASNNTDADITIIVDSSSDTLLYKSEVEAAVKEIAGNMKGGTLRIVSASSIPVTEYIGKPDLLGDFNLYSLKNPSAKSVNADLAIRLASNDLINAAKKRSIVLVTSGNPYSFNFENYNLSELVAYMNNNSIGFSVVQVKQGSVSEEISYICENTSGNLYYVFRPQGLSDVVKDIIESPQGIYQLSYTSSMQTNFGTKYLPLEAEVYLLNRSGRDETGYFAPLE